VEARVKNPDATNPPPAEADLKRLQHELEVQNESLFATQPTLQAALERINRETTERQQAERELPLATERIKDSAERYRGLFEAEFDVKLMRMSYS